MAINRSGIFKTTAAAAIVLAAGTSIALGDGEEGAAPEGVETEAVEVVEVTPAFTSAVTCVAPSDILEVDARTKASDAYRLSIDPSGITPELFAGLSNDELGFVKEDIIAQVQDNFTEANGPVADRLFHPSGTYVRTLAAGTGISGEGADMFNPDNAKRNLGAFAETIMTFAGGMDAADVTDPAKRDALQARLESTRDRVLAQVETAFGNIETARAAEVEALVAETPEGGEVSFCSTGLDQPVAE